MTRWVFNLGWALLLLLGLAAFLITAGRPGADTDPRVASYGPSGTSALADLLRLRGYQVIVDRGPKPHLSQNDIVIAFSIDHDASLSSIFSSSNKPDPNSDSGVEPESLPTEKVAEFIRSRSDLGLVVFWLPLAEQFEEASARANEATAYIRPDNQTRKLSLFSENPDSLDDDAVPLASTANQSFVDATRDGKGYNVNYQDGIGLTNRFLSRADNAQFFVETLKVFAPNSKRVVFTQGTFADTEAPGLLETLGPWAEGAWYQAIFLFVVIVWTLNQRFGKPLQIRKVQLGGRELVDALTDTMIRARASKMSLENALVDADARLTRLLKMRPDVSPSEKTAKIPATLEAALSRVRAAATMKKVDPQQALQLVISLEHEMERLRAQHLAVSVPRSKEKNLL